MVDMTDIEFFIVAAFLLMCPPLMFWAGISERFALARGLSLTFVTLQLLNMRCPRGGTAARARARGWLASGEYRGPDQHPHARGRGAGQRNRNSGAVRLHCT